MDAVQSKWLLHGWLVLACGLVPIMAVSISDYDLERAFGESEDRYEDILIIERNLYNSGGIIAKGTISPETRHQGNGGTEDSRDINEADERLQLATLALKNRKGLTGDQVQTELTKIDLSRSKSSKAREAYASCAELQQVAPCDRNCLYRTQDGSCNNLANPTYGKVNSCMTRFLPAKFEDGVSEPRKSVTGQALPEPRDISIAIHNDVDRPALNITLMVMQWGQFVDHDIALTPMIRTRDTADILDCCPSGNNNHPACIMPINIPPNDSFFARERKTCMNFVRSSGCNTNCTLGPKNMVNVVTHFVDASQIYGSNEDELDAVRAYSGGRLKYQSKPAGELLPAVSLSQNNQCTRNASQFNCFVAGDERVNEQPGLTSMHTIWLRQHNSIARQLQRTSNYSSEDELFQKTRRIVVAMVQHITYQDFLPVLLSAKIAGDYRLTTSGRTVYDPTINPSVLTDFATAAYRVGHTLIQNLFTQIDKYSNSAGNLNLTDNFFNQEAVVSGQMPSILAGMCKDPAQAFDRHVVESVSNNVYKVTGSLSGLDLPAINIQRGRDNGLRPYVDYLKACTNKQVTSFQDLSRFMNYDCVTKLSNTYMSVYDIDLFTGGLCENPVPNGVVGPTFASLIGGQFGSLKYGDRFYYEHDNGYYTNPFTNGQLREIRTTTLAKVVCENAKILNINQNVFVKGSRLVRCDSLPQPDFSIF